jgi:hypothetical protein
MLSLSGIGPGLNSWKICFWRVTSVSCPLVRGLSSSDISPASLEDNCGVMATPGALMSMGVGGNSPGNLWTMDVSRCSTHFSVLNLARSSFICVEGAVPLIQEAKLVDAGQDSNRCGCMILCDMSENEDMLSPSPTSLLSFLMDQISIPTGTLVGVMLVISEGC